VVGDCGSNVHSGPGCGTYCWDGTMVRRHLARVDKIRALRKRL